MIVKLRRRNRRYPDLTAGQPYVVIGIEADDYGRGFFEDFFDDKRTAVTTFWRVVNQRLTIASAAQGAGTRPRCRTLAISPTAPRTDVRPRLNIPSPLEERIRVGGLRTRTLPGVWHPHPRPPFEGEGG
jgi:hypothetical protein